MVAGVWSLDLALFIRPCDPLVILLNHFPDGNCWRLLTCLTPGDGQWLVPSAVEVIMTPARDVLPSLRDGTLRQLRRSGGRAVLA